MSKKKWALIILAVFLIWGYFRLFYKTYNEKAVAQSADCIIVLDVKRITNTLIWNMLTTPGQWKTGKLFSKKSKGVNWMDMVKLPDYIMLFHSASQPANAWYMLLTIKNNPDFDEGLKQFQFEKINANEYVSKTYGIHFFKQDDRILVANASVENKNLLAQVANELFTKRSYISKASLSKVVNANSHLAVYFAPNQFLQKEGIISANFDKKKISISGSLTPYKQFGFKETSFGYTDNSLCSMGFTQPSQAVYAMLNKKDKEKISTALNVNIDSVLLQTNTSYSLNLTDVKQRADSAISYTYDEEFNKVEKIIVNDIQEPAFDFLITGENVSAIYSYLQQSKKLEKTTAGDVFLPMPFVRSYCSKKNETRLSITASGYKAAEENRSVKAIIFLQIVLTKIPENLLRYLPSGIVKGLSNIAEINLSATKNKDQVLLNGVFQKKDNDLPVINF